MKTKTNMNLRNRRAVNRRDNIMNDHVDGEDASRSRGKKKPRKCCFRRTVYVLIMVSVVLLSAISGTSGVSYLRSKLSQFGRVSRVALSGQVDPYSKMTLVPNGARLLPFVEVDFVVKAPLRCNEPAGHWDETTKTCVCSGVHHGPKCGSVSTLLDSANNYTATLHLDGEFRRLVLWQEFAISSYVLFDQLEYSCVPHTEANPEAGFVLFGQKWDREGVSVANSLESVVEHFTKLNCDGNTNTNAIESHLVAPGAYFFGTHLQDAVTFRSMESSSEVMQVVTLHDSGRNAHPKHVRLPGHPLDGVPLLSRTQQMRVYAGLRGRSVLACGGFDVSDPRVCNGRGTCIARDRCKCNSTGYFGRLCQEWACDGIPKSMNRTVCSSHGVCVAPDKCECEPMYMGHNCSETDHHQHAMNVALAVVLILVGFLFCFAAASGTIVGIACYCGRKAKKVKRDELRTRWKYLAAADPALEEELDSDMPGWDSGFLKDRLLTNARK